MVLADPLAWLWEAVALSEELFGTRLPRLPDSMPDGLPDGLPDGSYFKGQDGVAATAQAKVPAGSAESSGGGGGEGASHGNEAGDDADSGGASGGGSGDDAVGGEVTGSSAERAWKHATQEAAVAAHLRRAGLLRDRGFTYVEFGAGAGGLAWACAQAAAALHSDAAAAALHSGAAAALNSDAAAAALHSDAAAAALHSGTAAALHSGAAAALHSDAAAALHSDAAAALHSDAAAALHSGAAAPLHSGAGGGGDLNGDGRGGGPSAARRPNVVLVERLPFPPATDRRWLAKVCSVPSFKR
jgi:hypothetical protein